jgi:hypothetical protein
VEKAATALDQADARVAELEKCLDAACSDYYGEDWSWQDEANKLLGKPGRLHNSDLQAKVRALEAELAATCRFCEEPIRHDLTPEQRPWLACVDCINGMLNETDKLRREVARLATLAADSRGRLDAAHEVLNEWQSYELNDDAVEVIRLVRSALKGPIASAEPAAPVGAFVGSRRGPDGYYCNGCGGLAVRVEVTHDRIR